MQVTISLIPASLTLVHIPRSRLSQLSHPIIKQILQSSSTPFVNITCNELEISLFGDSATLLEDFEPIARRDRQKQRARSGSSSSRRSVNGTAAPSVESIEISYEKWSVLQIDSHTDQVDNSGARVHSVSAPLSAAGISILYQSSYMSDFIFVKEWRLNEAIQLLTNAGFSTWTSDPHFLFSPSISPPHSPISPEDSISKKPDVDGAAIFILDRSSKSTAADASSPMTSLSDPTCPPADGENKSSHSTSTTNRNKSRSPSSGEVHVLPSDLACVGLDDCIDNWGLKLIKLLAFPELISPRPTEDQNQERKPDSSFAPRVRAASSDSSSLSSDEEDGYFSHSPRTNASTTSFFTSESSPDLTKPYGPPPSKHLVNVIFPSSPLMRTPLPRKERKPLSITTAAASKTSHRVPFFSFTRTQEGSSLTTNVRLLAALFPPHERHMVMCGGELDDIGADNDLLNEDYEADDQAVDEPEDDASDSLSGTTLKCLQIDLARFGLEKHGLVNRFSRVLDQNGINHMYSSTFKTANLLVAKKNVKRAQALLRSC